MPSSVQYQVLRHPCELCSDARALMARAEHESFELGMSWYLNFLEALPDLRRNAVFHVLRRDGKAVAVLPLMSEPGPPGADGMRSLANYYSALWAPALDATLTSAELAQLLREVLRVHATSSKLLLAPMDSTSAAWNLMRQALREAGLLTWDFFAFGNWYMKPEGGWATYLASRTGQLRNTLRRSSKRLQNVGAQIEIVTGGANLPRAIRAYQQVYAASWKRPEPHVTFIPGLIQTCAQQGWLRLGLVWLQERPIAAQLWIVAHGRASIYKLAYDEEFKTLGSGTVLTARLMQHVIDVDRVGEVDYLMGDDPYKRDWMSHRRERRGLVAYNPRTMRGLLGAARESGACTLRRLKLWWH